MPKFKVNQKVKIKVDVPKTSYKAGSVGEVIMVFDNSNENAYLINLNPKDKDTVKDCYMFAESELEGI